MRSLEQRKLPGYLPLIYEAGITLNVQYAGAAFEKDGRDQLVSVTPAVIALGTHDGCAILHSQAQQSVHPQLKGWVGPKLIIVAYCALWLAAQGVTHPAIGDACRFQRSGKVLAVGLRHVAAVWSAPHVDHESDVVLVQQVYKGRSFMVAVTHCEDRYHRSVGQVDLLKALSSA
jgi:hypothetical protein